tara:strand:+ start:259 stop:429 length:171 start_codon:yes stop_codon:yes gene_type:complete
MQQYLIEWETMAEITANNEDEAVELFKKRLIEDKYHDDWIYFTARIDQSSKRKGEP